MNKTLFLTFSLLFISCHKIKGSLEVKDHLQFINTDNKNDYLVEGEYNSKILIKKSKILLKVKNKYQKAKIIINVSKDYKLPSLNLNKIHQLAQETCRKNNQCDNDFTHKSETFLLSSSASGQPFDTKGKLIVHRKKSELLQTTEVCHVTPNLQECRLNENWRNNYSVCRDGFQGTRNVTYRIYDYTLDLSIKLSQDSIDKAEFKSNKKASYKEYLSFGMCNIN